ncbi:hypothetical protein [Psychroserpens sp. SPM9]|uniref:hypothetical protein n=1 Tax=Psychroserpens sp. SPM9 TaxID=2975598 RepID=UPI0021A5C6F6|nr:hypothetical protein [Psychroserpens sp. SPM9]MDG5492333.1 hypothetical protein [Psychroserpens sp. SPM9]
MKTQLNTLALILFSLFVISCSGDDDSGSGNNDAFGTIQLSGADTASVGNSLTVGNIDSDGLASTGTSSAVVLLDEDTTIENGELIPTNFVNAFVIVASQFDADDNADVDKAISMTILKNGEEFRYVCSTPPTSAANDTDCGTGFSVDKIAKEVVFDNTTVINVESGTILTMNGTINY